jgi:hypothetical protein
MRNGLPPLGLLNPFIYSRRYRGFTDIVHGGSNGCTGLDRLSGLSTPFVPYTSWNATVGWDPATGYGTLNFPKLVELSHQAGSLNEKRDVSDVVPNSSTTSKESYTFVFPTETDSSAVADFPTETDTSAVFVWPTSSTKAETTTVWVTVTANPTQRGREEGHETAT